MYEYLNANHNTFLIMILLVLWIEIKKNNENENSYKKIFFTNIKLNLIALNKNKRPIKKLNECIKTALSVSKQFII